MGKGYRSGLEGSIGAYLEKLGVPAEYEPFAIRYVVPAAEHRYTPDWHLLQNGIIIESKGRFTAEDRKKHTLIKEQHPGLDIRFVFQRPNERINKASKTTYALWCDRHGFSYAKKMVPLEWINEPPCPSRIAALEKAGVPAFSAPPHA